VEKMSYLDDIRVKKFFGKLSQEEKMSNLYSELDKKIEEFDSSLESFINREHEMRELLNTSLPIIIIYGSYGQGKTKLALKLVEELKKRNEEVIYIALRLMDNIYRGQFLTYNADDICKKYYNSIGISPKNFDLAQKFIMPLIVDPMGFYNTYKSKQDSKELIVITERPALNNPSVYSTTNITEILQNAKIKNRLTIIIDELEDLIETVNLGAKEEAARRFINNLFSIFRYAHDINPGLLRLVALVIPRTTIELKTVIRERPYAWVGKTVERYLDKLSESSLLEYGDKLIGFVLNQKDLKLKDILDTESLDLMKTVLRGITTTRFAVDMIKQIVKEMIIDLASRHGILKYDELLRNVSKLLQQKIHFNIRDYLKLYEPSHDEIVKNYRELLKKVKEVLMQEYNVVTAGPAPVTFAKGYESYFLDVGSKDKTVRFIFWLRPSGYHYQRGLNIDKVIYNLRLKESETLKIKTYVYVVSFRPTKHLIEFIDLLKASKKVENADILIHGESIKYGLSSIKPSGYLGNAIENYFDEEVKELANKIKYIHSILT
jgi:Cdc6-like AAA superfamily ATPase